MKNTILVPVPKPNSADDGFWAMSDEKAIQAKYLVAHDNKIIVRSYKIVKAIKCDLIREYEGTTLIKDEWKSQGRWWFHLLPMPAWKTDMLERQVDTAEFFGRRKPYTRDYIMPITL